MLKSDRSRLPLGGVGVLLTGLLLAGGCSAPRPCYSPEADRRVHSVYVIRRGQHTGIVVRVQDWPVRNWALFADFPQARYLEFGWGDEEYYQAEEINLRMSLAALLWPTPSVMQVVGFDELPEPASDDFVEVTVSEDGLRAMAASIVASFAGEQPEPTAPAEPPSSAETMGSARVRFYHARGNFYFPKMCNRWTAEQLEAAGCPIRPWTVVLAGRVMREARAFGAARQQHAAIHSQVHSQIHSTGRNLYGARVDQADASRNGNTDR